MRYYRRSVDLLSFPKTLSELCVLSSDDLLFEFHFGTFLMSANRLKQSVKLIGTKLSPAIDNPAR